MSFRRLKGLAVFAGLVLGNALPVAGQDDGVLAEIERLRPRDLKVEGFQLPSDQTVTIEAVGIRYRSKRHDIQLSNAWILNADTREMVWELSDADSDDAGDDLREYSDRVPLPAGRYEVYYTAWPSYDRSYEWEDDDDDGWFNDAWDGIFNHDYDSRDYRRAAKKFRVAVKGTGTRYYEEDVLAYQDKVAATAIIAKRPLEDDAYESIGLKLDRPMKIDVYAVGEANKEGNYDYAWIVSAETRETLWKLDYRESDRAGGAKKNRMARETISLKAGTYGLFIASDESHHFDDWNAAPPYDPFFWGVTIMANDPAMARHASIVDYREREEKNVIIKFAPLRDDEFRNEGFTLAKEMDVRIYAIGEGVDRSMYDYGWIMNADTREMAWEFTFRNSEHAGGGSKNRMADEVVRLPKGNYLAYAITDGSHSFRNWNAAAPHDREHWGMTIYAVSDRDRSSATSFVESDNPNVLAQIVRVGDDDYERVRFSLDKETKVRIYAIGEGNRGRMYDYPWLENRDSGKVVWEMTYRMTQHAGGAKKNRVVDETITLDAGSYVLYFESDGSHSFNDWNDRPPRDVWNWGVTVMLPSTQ